MAYNFCKNCGSSKVEHVNETYFKCEDCGHVFYPQPSVAVGAFIVKDEQILLVERLEEPYKNDWVIPSGFIDYGESPLDALEREMQEELGMAIKNPRLFFSQLGRENLEKPILGLYYLIEEFDGKLQAAADEIGQYQFFPLLDPPTMGFTANNEAYKYLIDHEYKKR
jgi:ADP-ribose pyrophosphatase YjhB (NUDIX family)